MGGNGVMLGRCLHCSMRIHPRRHFSVTSTSVTTPVVIVGGGPTGLLLSCLLSSYGTPSVLLEAQTPEERFRHPQAHFLNTRTMEILCHSLPSTYNRVLEEMPPVHQWSHFQWGYSMSNSIARVLHPVDSPLKASTDANGKLIPLANEEVEAPRSESESSPLSICSVAHLAQHQFCRLLWEAAMQHAGERARVEYGVEVNKVVEHDFDHDYPVLVTSAQGHSFRTKFVVAADGFHSSLRKSWNINMQGQSDIQNLVNVHIRIDDKLAKEIHSNNNYAMLHFIYNPSIVAVVVCHSVGEYVLQIPFFPPFQTLDRDFSPEKVRTMVEAALGLSESQMTEEDISILSVRQWSMSSLIAERYVSGNHFVLAGDSGHVFPPAGGLGMNTGLQDVHNLAWRISGLIHGNGDKEQIRRALRQYEQERRPVAQQNAALSVRNFNRTLELAKACLLNHKHPSIVMTMLASPPFNLMPLEARQELFRRLVKTAMLPLSSLQGKASRIGDSMRQSVRTILGRGGGLPLLFPKYELGFSYASKDTAKSPEKESWNGDTLGYSPKVQVGSLFPHATLRIVAPTLSVLRDRHPNLRPVGEEASDGDSVHVTTTDLPAQLRGAGVLPCFVLLLIDCSPSPSPILKYLKHELSQLDFPIYMVCLHSGGPSQTEDGSESDTMVLEDRHSLLRSMLPPIDDNAAFVLIRPDGHVASVVVVDNDLVDAAAVSEETGVIACPFDCVHHHVIAGVQESLLGTQRREYGTEEAKRNSSI